MPDTTAKVVRLEPETQRQVRARLARMPASAHQLHERGKLLLGSRMEAFFEASDDALFDLADKASSNQEQNLFFDSMREVRVQRKGIEKRFLEAVDDGFAVLVAPDQFSAQTAEGELSADALSLVQNDDLEQLVALESTVNRANRAFGAQIGRLSYGMRTLFSGAVTQQSNPFGPEYLCSAFMAQVKRLDIDIKAKLVLFKLFDRVVVNELPAIYKQLEAILGQYGLDVHAPVEATHKPKARKPQHRAGYESPDLSQFADPEADYGYGPAPSGGYASPAGPAPGGVGGGYSAGGDFTHEPTAGGAPGPVSGGTSTGGTAAANQRQLLELLSFVQKLPATATASRGFKIEKVLEKVQKHKGQQVQLGTVEHETIRLVEMLFDFILRDHTLANPVKEMLCRMQIPVLKVALMDRNFLTDKKHSARRLLNEMASQAIGWQSDGSRAPQEEPLIQCINGIIERILKEFDDDTDVFQQALGDFSAFVEKERRRSAVLEKRMVDAEDGKARAETARKTVAAEVEKQIGRFRLPKAAQELIHGPWSNVLFVTGLKHGFESGPWQDHLNLLADLIWSVQPQPTQASRQKLITRAPTIMQALRSGLDAVSYNPFEMSELLLQVEEIHIARIRGEQLPEERDQKPVLKPVPSTPVAHTAPTEKAAEQTAEPATALPADDPHMVTVAGFAPGSWFDLVEQEEAPLRCRLAAYIKPTGKYIFVSRAGMKVAEKTQQDLAAALKAGKLRAVDNSMLFDRALENIVTGMRKNKPSSPLDEARTGEQQRKK